MIDAGQGSVSAEIGVGSILSDDIVTFSQKTRGTAIPDIAAGAQIVVRDEEWLVRSVRQTEHDGLRIEVTGVSELVRDQDAVFFRIPRRGRRGRPEEDSAGADDSPGFRGSRLWLESMLRQSPAPVTGTASPSDTGARSTEWNTNCGRRSRHSRTCARAS